MSAVPVWLAKWPITWTWEQHRASGSLGGIDYATPVGTKIYAPSAGIVTFFTYSDGSSSIRVTRSDGSKTEFLHGHLVGSNRRQVSYEELIGTTDGRRGAPGAGPSTGPHVHVHDITAAGVRVPPFSTITSSTAGGDSTPIHAEEEDDMEPKIIGHKDQEVAIIAPWLPNGYLTEKLGTDVAVGWARLYSPTKDSLVPMYDRDVYLTMIAGAKALAAGYQAALPNSGSGDNTPVLDAIIEVSEKMGTIPTAAENGAAARAAIIKEQ